MLGLVAAGVGAAVAGLLLLDHLVPWLRIDLMQLYVQISVMLRYKLYIFHRCFIIDALEKQARDRPNKAFIIFQGKEYSYEYVNQQANRVAHVAIHQLRLQKGDIVALLFRNEPAFFWTFYGLAKVGVQVAFLNFNLRSSSLLHCFKVCRACRLFIGQGDDLVHAVEEIADDLDPGLVMYTVGHDQVPKRFRRLDDMLASASVQNIDINFRGITKPSDVLCYIFTSGTTGLPKAAVISQLKQMKAACLMLFYNLSSDDVIYCPLPLYHSAASMIACGNTVLSGATLVMREKFSASQFWDDCCRHDVTIIHYIGELCRYLINTPETPSELKHKVRLGFGNGLRRDVWTEFQRRFHIPVIGEFYAATEGNCGFINILNVTGSVGRISPLLEKLFPVYFIKYDFETAEPLRDETGCCQVVAQGEPGLMIAPVRNNFEYDGYMNDDALTKNKIICDVFQLGDIFCNSGDLFTVDSDYNIFFCDRLGDTFRWHGENVSTIEVSNVVAELPEIQDANVFGVSMPGNEGRAGMAAVTLQPSCTALSPALLAVLYERAASVLPTYALPRFLRVCHEMKMSSTHKQLKMHLVKAGFDPATCEGDSLFYVDFKSKTFKPLDHDAYMNIINGTIRL